MRSVCSSSRIIDWTYSLATAAHSPSDDKAMSRTGSVHRRMISSMELVSSEYLVTEPSSAPTREKSLLAATARCVSVRVSIMGGSPSELCWNTRKALLDPAVTILVPLLEYAQYVGPGAWAGRPRSREAIVDTSLLNQQKVKSRCIGKLGVLRVDAFPSRQPRTRKVKREACRGVPTVSPHFLVLNLKLFQQRPHFHLDNICNAIALSEFKARFPPSTTHSQWIATVFKTQPCTIK
jgi:hypothetical protein